MSIKNYPDGFVITEAATIAALLRPDLLEKALGKNRVNFSVIIDANDGTVFLVARILTAQPNQTEGESSAVQ